MKLKDMKFRVVKDGKEHIFGWDAIFGYEGEDCGVFARVQDADDITLTNNSGYGFKGINADLEIEVVDV